jgi:CcmD family protein
VTILAASDVTLPDNSGYVVAAYLVFLVLLLIYVAIMAMRLTRVERELSELNELAAKNEAERDRSRTAA